MHGHVLAPHRRQPEGPVRLGIRLGADPKEPEVEHPESGSERSFPGGRWLLELRGHQLARPRQGAGQLEHPLVLLRVAA